MFHKIRELNWFYDQNSTGKLVALDDKILGFEIKRCFSVNGKKGSSRGKHAHKKLTQVITCLNGKCHLFLTDGEKKLNLTMTSDTKPILIPPMIWGEQTYLEDDTIISVFCDRYYEEDDYIHNFSEFCILKENLK